MSMTFSPRATLLFALLAAFSPWCAAAGSEKPNAAGDPSDLAKPYTLYLGADVAVEWKGELRPVCDVDGNSFVVLVEGRRVTVPSNDTRIKLKIDNALKVTPNSALVTKFKAERGYTAARDPNRKISEASGSAVGAQAMTDAAANNVRDAQTSMGLAYATVEFATGGGPGAKMEPLPDSAWQSQRNGLEAAGFAQGSNSLNSVPEGVAQAEIEAARQDYDALTVTFVVSAPRPLVKPYVILLAKYRDKSGQPSTANTWVYAQALPRVDASPRTVRFARGGFPLGYQLDDVEVHLFDNGTELATPIARKRVGITADEAFQFSVVEFVQSHRDATTQPEPVRQFVPRALAMQIPGEQLNRTFYVRVGKNGMPTGVYLDEKCTAKVDDREVEAALLALRFNPALNKGKPVEGVAAVQPRNLRS